MTTPSLFDATPSNARLAAAHVTLPEPNLGPGVRIQGGVPGPKSATTDVRAYWPACTGGWEPKP
jgi:hypothetical protein